jgi:hypothetical protein
MAVPKDCPALKVLTPSWLCSTLAACEVRVSLMLLATRAPFVLVASRAS